MDLASTSLIPGHLRSVTPNVFTDYENLPLTPFFFPAGNAPYGYTRSFSGLDFYPQNQYTTDSGTAPICGFEAYKSKTIAQDYVAGEVYVGHLVSNSYDWEGVLDYNFNTGANTLTVDESITTTGTLYTGILGSPLYTQTTNTRTGTFFHDETAPKVDHDDTNDYLETLSDAVTGAWLLTNLETWMAQTEAFREATGDYLTAATRSETADGLNCTISGGLMRHQGYWFSGTPTGMTGDEGTHWNGNYSAYLIGYRRKNAPVLYASAGVTAGGAVFTGFTISGESIYGNGTEEMELEDEVTGFLVDPFGVYEWTMGTWDSLLADTALGAVDYIPSAGASILSLGGVDPTQPNEALFVSRTGKQYQIIIELGETVIDEFTFEESWVQGDTRTVTTDATTLQAVLRPDAADDPAWVGRFISIEARASADSPWVMISNADTGAYPDLPLPTALIGNDVGDGTPLFGAYRARDGVVFGFPALDFGGGFYRKQTYRQHRTTYGAGTLPDVGCGSAFPSGASDTEWEQEYIDGVLQDKVLLEHSRTVGATDWSRESPPMTETAGSVSGDTIVTDTATMIKMETTGQTYDGSFTVSFDLPDPNGKILSTTATLAALSIDGTDNFTTEQDIDPPAAGSTIYFSETRLTY